ncbi:MAG: YheU family protein [Geobacteraceae bacterium]|nr:YheU family protein [Geobacteraceae bacterium]NTW79777.1 YheU family protein [Geobacteraceae bacterium]
MDDQLVTIQKQTESLEEGIEIPFEQINPDTLRNMISEFVTREWADLGDSDYTLDDKIAQVLKQLQDNRAKVVFDLTSESWNIVACR